MLSSSEEVADDNIRLRAIPPPAGRLNSKTKEENKMKKKIILVAFCLILFLVFTALSYGRPDPKKLREDPWEHLKSPKSDDNQNLNFVLLVINPDLYLSFTFQSKVEILKDSDKLANHKSNASTKQGSGNKNERKFQK
jgi:hypothetical protein